jgi:asparagine synthase (glutamine-hydrolysing)
MNFMCGEWAFGAIHQTAGGKFPAADACSKTELFCDGGVRLMVREMPVAVVRESSPRGSTWQARFTVVWHGRLDNGADIVQELRSPLTTSSSEVDIVAAAYHRWKTDAFRRLKGDWSIAIWNAEERCVVLARDPMGMRPLFFAVTAHAIKWSSSLDWMVRTADRSLQIDFEYLAGWLSFFPSPHVTPYSSIAAVPPSSFIKLRPGETTVRKYWEFQPTTGLECRTNSDYEERFRTEFAAAVRRRLRSTKPMLAELSGGVDSSSIVCMADTLLSKESGLAPKLDTLSYFDDDEPNWNERPFFALIEAKRGRAGYHLDAGSGQELSTLLEHSGEIASAPTELLRNCGNRESVRKLMQSGDYDGILSGIGGDEFTGGVPTPIPELADLLVSLRFREFARQLNAWSLAQRRPWIHLLLETVRSFAPPLVADPPPARRPPPWLSQEFRDSYRSVLRGYEKSLHVFGSMPSFQENLATVEALRRQICASQVGSDGSPEKRYPFLDVDFLQFLFSVPREQLIELRRRRSLMRRSLAGLVPDEILNRKRKAYVTRSPRTAIALCWPKLESLTRNMASEALGIVSSKPFVEALRKARAGQDAAILPLYRALLIECWLQNLVRHRVVSPGSRFERASSESAFVAVA